MSLRNTRIILWVLVGLSAFVALALSLGYVQSKPQDRITGVAAIGGTFSMVNQKGEPVTEKTFLGKPTLMFFGFTHCPDICPTTMATMGIWLKELGNDASNVNMVFVTIDPERDTPEQITQFLSMYDERIVGLTGTHEQIKNIIKAYRIVTQRRDIENGAYIYDHTSSTYLMDANGQFTGTLDEKTNPQLAAEKIRKLIKS